MNDIEIARRYLSKATRAEIDGYEFDLTFVAYKNLMRAKFCKYSGLRLTTKRRDKTIRFTDRTIDRIDSSKGYVKGNCVAVCNGVNKFKGMLENPNNLLSAGMAIKIAKIIEVIENKN